MNGDRRALFWISASIATALYLFCGTSMLIVPGVEVGEKLAMLGLVAVASATGLAVGIWKPTTTDPPVMNSRLALVMSVLLGLEFVHSGVSFLVIAAK